MEMGLPRYDVSIHAPVWVRPVPRAAENIISRVSIHAPVWVRLLSYKTKNSLTRFQFTHPCGCDEIINGGQPPKQCFNSRTRVGATPTGETETIIETVSIHAPVWVRLRTLPSPPPGKRFQFTHPCGCDPRRQDGLPPINRFNSRTRVGATPFQNYGQNKSQVSIHAPVWVRHFPVMRIPQFLRFQFTHPCGCDYRTR